MCNCGKSASSKPAPPAPPEAEKGTTQQFALEAPSGSRTFYGSRLEANAARIRSGSGIVRAV